ncbi:MAG: hypothetical protein ACKVQR_07685 [Aquabacterium sp.]
MNLSTTTRVCADSMYFGNGNPGLVGVMGLRLRRVNRPAAA